MAAADGVRQWKSKEWVITIVACIGVLVYCIMIRSCRMSSHFLIDHHYLNWIRVDRTMWMDFSGTSCIHHTLARIRYSSILLCFSNVCACSGQMCKQSVIVFDTGLFTYFVAMYQHRPTSLIGEAYCCGYTELAVAFVFECAP